jgi:hypothetical protein
LPTKTGFTVKNMPGEAELVDELDDETQSVEILNPPFVAA